MPDTSIEPAGLAPPDQGPTFGFKSRERIEDRTTRKPMSLWDRIKLLVLLVGLFAFFVLAQTGDNPILPMREAIDQQFADKWWMAALFVLEVVRQIHYLISEKSAAVPPVLDRAGLRRAGAPPGPDERLDPLPPRAGPAVRRDAGRRGHGPRGPARHLADPGPGPAAEHALGRPAHDPAAGVRRRLHHHPVRGDVLVPVPGRDGRLLPRRHQDPVLRRLGPGQRPGEDQGEHRLPRGPRVHREEGRLRARRPAPLGPSRHRQDADGRGRRRRDGQALRLRRPGRLHPDVHGRRHPEGQVPVPQAAPALGPLRRGHRLLRRGRLPRQPWCADPRRRVRRPHDRCDSQPLVGVDELQRAVLRRPPDGQHDPAELARRQRHAGARPPASSTR